MSNEKLIKNLYRKQGIAFVCSAPPGTGKTTLVQMLLKEFSGQVVQSISYTTRSPREGEVNGDHYNFISEEEFEERAAKDEFLEYINLYGHYYGTSRAWFEERLNSGKHVFLVIDTQGALQLKGKLKAVFIFLMPPSLETLRNRLQSRQTETNESIEKRMAWAQKEVETARYYDYCIVNDDLQKAYDALRSIVIAEEHRILRL